MMEAFKYLKKYFKGNSFVKVDVEKSTIAFTIQDGPIREVGVNGTQIDEIGKAWLKLIEYFNMGEARCRENSLSITKIEEALMWQNHRKIDRTERKVEGLNKP
jgi:hypothetical protein